jgi:cell division septal protein FtsQ
MRKLLRVALWGMAAGGVALAAAWLPDALAELEVFRAREYRVAGTRLLEDDQVLAAAAISPFLSVFDDLTEIEQRLELHPLIRRARVSSELPKTLVVSIEERDPVGFVAGPVLEPVDRDGRVLPLDPVQHRLDLPVLFRAGGGSALSPSELQVLATEVDRLGADDPTFLAAVSEIAIDEGGDAIAVVSGDLLFRFRPPLSHRRLRDGLTVLEDAVLRQPDRRAAVIDLRFEDQIVVQYVDQRAGARGSTSPPGDR